MVTGLRTGLRRTSAARPSGRRQPTDDIRVSTGLRLAGRWLVIALTAAVIAIPLGFVLARALADNARGVREMVHHDTFWSVLRTTLELTAGSLLIAVPLGTALAWCVHFLPRQRRWLSVFPFAPLLVPPLALVTGWAFLVDPNIGFLNQLIRWLSPFGNPAEGPFDVYTMTWIVIITGLGLASFVFVFVRASLGQLQQEVIDAAAASGAGSIRTFLRVILPLIRPGIVYGALTVVLLSLGQFAVPLLLGRQHSINVLTTEIYYRSSTFPPDYALASALGLPVLVGGLVFLAVQRYVLRDQGRFVTAGGRSSQPLTTNGWKAQLFLVCYAVITVAGPLLALCLVALQPYWSKDVSLGALTLDNFRTVLFDRVDLSEAIRNSLLFAAGTALIVLPVGYVCARVIYLRSQSPLLAAAQDVIVSAPLGIPAVIFGQGFLLAYTQSPLRLYGEDLGLILVYVAIMVPFSVRLQLVAMVNLGLEPHAAAAAAGAGWFRRLVAIELPLLRPALASAAALVVVMTSYEFSASVLVRSQETQVMGTVLYDLWNFGSYPHAAVMALLMCLVTAIGVGLVGLWGGRGQLEGVYRG